MVKNHTKKLLAKIPKSYQKFFKFGIVGGVGTVINTAVLWLLTSFAGLYYIAAAVIATEVAIISNFFGNHVFTFKGNKDPTPLKKKFTKFQLISITTVIGTVFLLWLMTTLFGIKYLLVWNLVAIFIMFTLNFFLNKKFTWKERVTSVVFVFVILGLAQAATINVSVGGNHTNNTIPEVNVTIPPTNTTLPDNNSSNSTGVNVGWVNVYSAPSGASISIDGKASGITPRENISVSSGRHDVSISLNGYSTKTIGVNVNAGQIVTLNVSLTGGGNPGSTITDSDTNLKKVGGTYAMDENDEGIFTIETSSNAEVIWEIDGIEKETTSGTNHEFAWTPGILFSGSGSTGATVEAITGNESVSWEIDVQDVINPFFSPDSGRDGTTLHIFVQHREGYEDIENLTATIGSSVGGGGTSYALTENELVGESEWIITIADESLASGINYLTRINFVLDGDAETYPVSTSESIRAFYKDVPNEGGGGGSGGGGGGGSSRDEVELIYVTLSEDTVEANGTQTVTLDARGTQGVYSVIAAFESPSKETREIELELIRGSRGYGTWSANFSMFPPGLHRLSYIEIQGRSSSSLEKFEITDRTFYVVDGFISDEEELVLVYVVLEKSETDVAGEVSFRIDARDEIGVLGAEALVKKTKGTQNETFTVPLERISGNAKYGTWEGNIYVNEPYSTYEIIEITLWNENGEKKHQVSERSLYATGDVPDLGGFEEETGGLGFLTGYTIFNENTYKKPLFPAVAGFVIFIGIVGAALTYHNIKRRKEETR